MGRKFLVVVTSIIFGAIFTYNVYADDYTVGVSGRVWAAELDGKVKATDNALIGTKVDFDSDLGVDTKDEFGEVEIFFNLAENSRFNLHIWDASFSGSEIITKTIDFGGSTFTASTKVKTALDMTVCTLTYERILYSPKIQDVGFQVGVQVGVKYLDVSGELRAPEAPIPYSEKEKVSAPIPVLGVRVKADITNWISVEAQVNGLTISNIRDVDATIIEAVGEVRANIYRGFYAGGGYHLFKINVEADDSDEEFELDTSLSGFFFSLGYRF